MSASCTYMSGPLVSLPRPSPSPAVRLLQQLSAITSLRCSSFRLSCTVSPCHGAVCVPVAVRLDWFLVWSGLVWYADWHRHAPGRRGPLRCLLGADVSRFRRIPRQAGSEGKGRRSRGLWWCVVCTVYCVVGTGYCVLGGVNLPGAVGEC